MKDKILKEIKSFYKDNGLMPSIRYIQKKLNIKSTNTVYYYLNKLEEEHYLIRNKTNKRILNQKIINYSDSLMSIKVLNGNDLIKISLNSSKNYLAFKMNNNYFKKEGIKKDDLLIIEEKTNLKNNDLGLFIINKNYYIMRYYYQDGFYILEDNDKHFFNKIDIIGKVIMLERTIK